MNRFGSLNHVYRLVWSYASNCWIPVAETMRAKGNRSTSVLIAATLPLIAGIVEAGPLGGQVVGGGGSITQSGTTTTIRQTTQDLSLTWKSFDIAPQETVDFVQPSVTSIAVNRIFDVNGTQILGHLNANGQVYLINPNGIVFGKGAQVNVGGLVASTLGANARIPRRSASHRQQEPDCAGQEQGHFERSGNRTELDRTQRVERKDLPRNTLWLCPSACCGHIVYSLVGRN